ncbi:MAG: Gfo/Idh/MocA family oxidoreductase [Candidatus Woesearchaeota archaeon]|jgi:UDP-N-acetyl-2-amino-2-deoxyglucuronate dehydrogenase|nr:Gfo/Idh/MocA family oxidoreductase [Candidatus Woesearchaeota archaeon]MDP7323199.1 Gfo/Idh/MocA family oxidoreductase [Candidatus Woesearchaeota archaeon]MDP7458283.1 Gfo/Idh/MocA family oxidoreductase [Candidatus Woesearchaeota archaeon]
MAKKKTGVKKIRIGVAGCGRVAPYHFHAIKSIDDCELVAVCDAQKDLADKAAKEQNTKGYYDYGAFLKDKNIDVVSICTPHGLHADMAIKAAQAGKHIITEKPMAMNVADADAMIKAAKDNDVKLFVIKQNRYNPPVVKLKEALNQGRFGKLVLLNTTVRWTRPQEYFDMDKWRGTKEMDGGVFMNQASHHIDLVQWMGGDVKSVFAYGGTRTHKLDVEDTAVGVIKFKSGAMGVIEATTCTYPKNIEGSLTVLGEKGSVKVGGFAVNKIDIWEFSDHKMEDDWVKEMKTEPPNVYGFGHLELYKDLVNCLLNNKEAMMEGNEGRKSLELVMALYKSMQTGKEVSLPLKE